MSFKVDFGFLSSTISNLKMFEEEELEISNYWNGVLFCNQRRVGRKVEVTIMISVTSVFRHAGIQKPCAVGF